MDPPSSWCAVRPLSLLLAALLGFTACSSAPARVESSLLAPSIVLPGGIGSEIAMRAMALAGTPYRYGGTDPAGMDCSGLVYYVHQALGYTVPRTAREQFEAARHIDTAQLEPGDLLFFKVRSRSVSHVGVYVGEGRFIHAPQTGRPVGFTRLDDAYYRERLVAVGRLYEN